MQMLKVKYGSSLSEFEEQQEERDALDTAAILAGGGEGRGGGAGDELEDAVEDAGQSTTSLLKKLAMESSLVGNEHGDAGQGHEEVSSSPAISPPCYLSPPTRPPTYPKLIHLLSSTHTHTHTYTHTYAQEMLTIHKENMKRINQMSPEEREQGCILPSLAPHPAARPLMRAHPKREGEAGKQKLLSVIYL